MREIYHVYNKSIANFTIFNDESEFNRVIKTIDYYKSANAKLKFSQFISQNQKLHLVGGNGRVSLIAYCLMPTHLHLILEVIKEKGISHFISDVLNSYTRYFNIKHKRKGPLWEGRTKKVLIESDEQLLHLTRYVHLNPVTAYLVNKPEEWLYSSYREYIEKVKNGKRICSYNYLLEINPSSYKEFVDDRISYQRELAKIKNLSLE